MNNIAYYNAHNGYTTTVLKMYDEVDVFPKALILHVCVPLER